MTHLEQGDGSTNVDVVVVQRLFGTFAHSFESCKVHHAPDSAFTLILLENGLEFFGIAQVDLVEFWFRRLGSIVSGALAH